MPVAVCVQTHLCCRCLSRNRRPLMHDETLSSYTADTYVSSLSAMGRCISGEKLKIQKNLAITEIACSTPISLESCGFNSMLYAIFFVNCTQLS